MGGGSMADIYASGARYVLHAGCGITWRVDLWVTPSVPLPDGLLFLPAPTDFEPGQAFDGPVALGFGMSGYVASKLYEDQKRDREECGERGQWEAARRRHRG